MTREFVHEPFEQNSWHPFNAMSVDVEEYFQVSAFEDHVAFERWHAMPSRVEPAMDRILELFANNNVRATFFTLGWIAERHPAMTRRIVACGHEIASHGMNHVRVVNQNRRAFGADIRRAKAVLEDVTGTAVKGYRAPSFSLGESNLWAFDELANAGYLYSSSIYPGPHPAYGMPDAPRFAFRVSPSGILEIPVTTGVLAGRRFPCAGGGFFRLYPYEVTRRALARVNRQDRRSALFYFHPWEIDPRQPRIDGLPIKTRVRHYLNLGRVESRLKRLVADFSWDRMDQVFLADRNMAARVDRARVGGVATAS